MNPHSCVSLCGRDCAPMVKLSLDHGDLAFRGNFDHDL